MQTKNDSELKCFHCGQHVSDKSNSIEDKLFCCSGCKMVYSILNEHQLCTYYELNQSPGVSQRIKTRANQFDFLDNADIANKLIQFADAKQTHVTFYLPQIHCSSCLWLLEYIYELNPGIISSRVNFTKKEVFVVFDQKLTTLRGVVETLTEIGYEPHLSLNQLNSKSSKEIDRTRWYKIGIAGFCFANIMMMSLAGYFSLLNAVDPSIDLSIKIISIILSIPVLLYSASEFFVSAYKSAKSKILNLDFPVALALVITFARSIYEIATHSGNGYLDSMSGIVFFMLIGRWLQARTYQSISFDRDYKSFFPIALHVIKNGEIVPTEMAAVKEKDMIQIHSGEMIPVDAMLSKGEAMIDYSFVSGESEPVKVEIGNLVYAGGKQIGGLLELMVVKEVSQGYLTNLWNQTVFENSKENKSNIYDYVGKYFTYAVLLIGVVAGLHWFSMGKTDLMWNAITTVLIVACPCALLLSKNYTQGNILRIFGLNQFYLRHPEVIDKLTEINHIVLDKTGTITTPGAANIRYSGVELTMTRIMDIASLLKQSSHPASRGILEYLNVKSLHEVTDFNEKPGAGIEGWVNDHHIKIGSAEFTGAIYSDTHTGSRVYIYMDGLILGSFLMHNKYRLGIKQLFDKLRAHYSLSLISGDNNAELQNIEQLLGADSEVRFNQDPHQKLNYINHLQSVEHKKILMVGDGLNDAGALKRSDVGIAVADTNNTFTPSCDAVIDGSRLTNLYKYLHFAQVGKHIIFFCFAISAIYNIIGLAYAVQGILSPVVAAILMPCSSVTIIIMTYGLTEWYAKKLGMNANTNTEQ